MKMDADIFTLMKWQTIKLNGKLGGNSYSRMGNKKVLEFKGKMREMETKKQEKYRKWNY